MPKLRKIILLVFVGGYLGVAPLTILYALGYIFSPSQQTLLPTGLVSLSSEPSQARVWVNGSPVKEKTPLVLRGLRPGAYLLQVSLPGYHPWQKRFEMKADKALRFEKILLFPVAFRPEILGNFPVTKLWSDSGGKRLVVGEGEKASGLSLFELEKKEFRPIFSSGPDREAYVDEVLAHPSGDRGVVILRNKEGLRPLLIKFFDPVQISALTHLIEEPFTQLEWGAPHENSLFYLKGETLRHLDLEQGALYLDLPKRVRGFSLYGRRLFVLDGKRRFLELTEKGKIRQILLDEPLKAQLIFGPDGGEHYSILFLPRISLFSSLENAIALFLSDKGKLSSSKLPYFLDEGVDEFAIANSRPRALYRKGTELWVVDFERERERTFFENGPTPRRIYKGKEAPAHLLWFYDDRYVLFLEGNRLKVLDFEGEGEAMELLEISSRVREIVLDRRRGFLYFAHPDRDRLARVKLFEGEGLF